MPKKDISQWLKDQFRMAGEELIRRSEAMSFDGWDGLTDVAIQIAIPTYSEYVQVPEIDITFTTINKTVCDSMIAGGTAIHGIVNHDRVPLSTLAPECSDAKINNQKEKE